MHLYLISRALLAGFTAITFSPHLQASELTLADAESASRIPVVYPGSECLHKRLRVPESVREKGYRYLSNKDCTMYFVLPPEISKQRVKVIGHGGLGFCGAYNIAAKTQDVIERRKLELLTQLEALTRKAFETESTTQQLRIQVQIDGLDKKIGEIQDLGEENIKNIYKTYNDIKGATYTILLANQIDPNDLMKLEDANSITYKNPDAETNGLPEYVTASPPFRPANLQNSTYSFTYIAPENRLEKDSVISTSFPGFTHVEQANTSSRVAHVKLDNVATASMTLSLVGVCAGTTLTETGEYVIDPNRTDDVFVVNRSYSVNRSFSNGYEAILNLDGINEQIVKEVIQHHDGSFRKDQTFSDILTKQIDQVVEFVWTEQVSNPEDKSTTEDILKIKQAVTASFIDDYFDALVDNGKLIEAKPAEVEPASGGFQTSFEVQHRCWTKKFLIFRTRRCGNNVYEVKNWVNGMTDKSLTEALDIQFLNRETIEINQTIPFYYSSTFTE